MPEQARPKDAEIARLLDESSLGDWIASQRWYASKSRSISGVDVVEHIVLGTDPLLVLALIQTTFATGTHELYQLFATDNELDALGDPGAARELLARIAAGEEIETEEGCFRFHPIDGLSAQADDATTRLVAVEQSNSSIVFDEALVLKVFRKLEPGINPELEMLRFLTHRSFPNIARLQGWYDYDGQALAATLGVAQTFLPEAIDGWGLALEEIASTPGTFLGRLESLGQVTAEMHNVLASDTGDPAFSPEEPSQEALSLLTATVDEEIERMFARLPDTDALAPIAGRGEDVRERLAIRAQISIGGSVIRTHGDYHLGQTLSTPRGWVIIDFEGEPARALTDRRRKRSALRDVASMLRSFAYATSAVEILRGASAPVDFEEEARQRFLGRYLKHIDAKLLPHGEAQVANLLAIFELEKAIYELQYELDNRPDWVAIPVAGIKRLLEAA